MFNPLRDRLGLGEGAFHAFRHGSATAQLQAGASIVTVKENLGHAKIETTLRYTHAVSGISETQWIESRDYSRRFGRSKNSNPHSSAAFCGELNR